MRKIDLINRLYYGASTPEEHYALLQLEVDLERGSSTQEKNTQHLDQKESGPFDLLPNEILYQIFKLVIIGSFKQQISSVAYSRSKGKEKVEDPQSKGKEKVSDEEAPESLEDLSLMQIDLNLMQIREIFSKFLPIRELSKRFNETLIDVLVRMRADDLPLLKNFKSFADDLADRKFELNDIENSASNNVGLLKNLHELYEEYSLDLSEDSTHKLKRYNPNFLVPKIFFPGGWFFCLIGLFHYCYGEKSFKKSQKNLVIILTLLGVVVSLGFCLFYLGGLSYLIGHATAEKIRQHWPANITSQEYYDHINNPAFFDCYHPGDSTNNTTIYYANGRCLKDIADQLVREFYLLAFTIALLVVCGLLCVDVFASVWLSKWFEEEFFHPLMRSSQLDKNIRFDIREELSSHADSVDAIFKLFRQMDSLKKFISLLRRKTQEREQFYEPVEKKSDKIQTQLKFYKMVREEVMKRMAIKEKGPSLKIN